MYTLTQLNIFPIKSLGGISLSSARLTDRGLNYDRRWMLVRPDGRFLTQRQQSQMALCAVSLGDGVLRIEHKHHPNPPLETQLHPNGGEEKTVQIWKDTCLAWRVDPQADAWFSEVLDMECQLVYMPDSSRRLVEAEYRPEEEVVSFADGYPCLLIGSASLDGLNQRLKQAIGMERFRPNLVVQTQEAHEEDRWHALKVGEVSFFAVKPCARCQIPSIDPATGKQGLEPSKTLSQYRRSGNKVLFGMNLLHEQSGLIRLGDQVQVVSQREPAIP